MAKRNRVDVVKILSEFQSSISQNKPTHKKMYEEVRMMHFKIRPVQGDIMQLNLRDRKFIEVLWNLGKLDEFFDKEEADLNETQREIFFRYFDNLYDKLQDQLNSVKLRDYEDDKAPTIEMEIYKEESERKLN